MQTIRVLVASHPRLMRDLVLATIAEEPDMEIAGEVTGDDIVNAAVEYRPDFIIVFAENLDERPAVCSELLARYPQAKVLALAPERNLGALFWAVTDIRSTSVESSEQGILAALRGKRQSIESSTVIQ
jgi:DNA-binding NarL/FixJ family response regulator